MQLHYRTLFSLQKSKAAPQNKSIYQIAIYQIGMWLNEHLRANHIEDNCITTSLFKGGKFEIGKIFIETRTLNYNDDNRTAPYWALKFDHSDSEFTNRIWRTDIAIHFDSDNSAKIIITVSWFLTNTFIGQEPSPPSISAPRIVRYFLTNTEIDCLADDYKLEQWAKKMEIGDGRNMYKHIIDPNRTIPIIVINSSDNRALINPHRLQKLLLGNAFVYWYNSYEVQEELQFQWAKNTQLNTLKDSIRIYRPWTSSRNSAESKMHPFFLFKNYESDPEVLTSLIVSSLYRSLSSSYVGERVKDVSSIYSLSRSYRLKELRLVSESIHHSSSPEDLEYFQALAEENNELVERLDQLEGDLREQEKTNSDLLLDLQIAQEEVKRIENDFNSVANTQSHFSSALKGFENVRSKLEKLPSTPHEVLTQIEHLYKDKLHILPEAVSSSREAEYDDTHEIWDLLINMAKHLPDLHFERDSVNVETEFRASTGYALTLKESSQTKADNRLMELRKRLYDGQEIDISAHTKLDRNGKNLRVHYYPDNTRKLIVIGHFGNHMETAGTKRRKEG